MATDGPRYAGAVTVSARVGSDGGWFTRDPDYWPVGHTAAFAQGPAHDFLSPNPSDYLRLTGYGFNIPANATIVGIEATVGIHQLTNSSKPETIQLVLNGAHVGDNKASGAAAWTADGDYVYGSPTDDWNCGLTPADFNDPTFGIDVADLYNGGGGSRVGVQYAGITVYYTIPGSPHPDQQVRAVHYYYAQSY